jgi:hypothetical protein
LKSADSKLFAQRSRLLQCLQCSDSDFWNGLSSISWSRILSAQCFAVPISMLFTAFSTMNLGCLSCNTIEGSTKSFRMEDSEFEIRSLSVRSQDDRVCLTTCWAAKKQQPHLPPPPSNIAAAEPVFAQGSKVAPLADDEDIIPRLTRCYAIRRDCILFQNWSVNDVAAATLISQ